MPFSSKILRFKEWPKNNFSKNYYLKNGQMKNTDIALSTKNGSINKTFYKSIK